jgi:hypothetical protein
MSAGNQKDLNCTNWTIMQNELGQSPRVVVCPADDRNANTTYNMPSPYIPVGTFAVVNCSYFIGMNANENFPLSVLGGDRNICKDTTAANNYAGYGYSGANASPATPYDTGTGSEIKTNSTTVCWSLKIHSAGNTAGAGNVLLGDGSVQQYSSGRFRSECLANTSDTVINAANPYVRVCGP